jgi:excisionase family DNA binding protein
MAGDQRQRIPKDGNGSPVIPYRKCYPIGEVAVLLGVGYSTVHRMIVSGKLLSKWVEGRRLVTGQEIDRYIEQLPNAETQHRPSRKRTKSPLKSF